MIRVRDEHGEHVMIDGMYQGLRLRAGQAETMGLLQRSVDRLLQSHSGAQTVLAGASRDHMITIYSGSQYPSIEALNNARPGSSRALHVGGDISVNGDYLSDTRVGASIVGHELRHRIDLPLRDAGTLTYAQDEQSATLWEQAILREL
jgi:hypothetical protein